MGLQAVLAATPVLVLRAVVAALRQPVARLELVPMQVRSEPAELVAEEAMQGQVLVMATAEPQTEGQLAVVPAVPLSRTTSVAAVAAERGS